MAQNQHAVRVMRRRTALVAAFLLLVLSHVAVSRAAGVSGEKPVKVPPELAAMITSAVDNAIVPAYQFFAAVSDKTVNAVDAWCSAPSPVSLQEARTAFTASVHAWARIQHIRFGPARTGNRWQRIAFLPDPRGIVRRQVAKVLAERPSALLADNAIAEQSAGLQGLPALELLLFTAPANEPDETARFRCWLARQVAAHVATLARGQSEDWTAPDGWRQRLLTAGPGNKDYQSANEAAAELVRALLTGLQIVREEMLLPWLKAAEQKKAWVGLPFERSGNARDVVSTALVAQRNLHKALHLDLVLKDVAAKDTTKRWMTRWVSTAYEQLERDVNAMALPSAETVAAAAAESNLTAIRRCRFSTNGLRQIIGREIAPASALTIGFNELDGD